RRAAVRRGTKRRAAGSGDADGAVAARHAPVRSALRRAGMGRAGPGTAPRRGGVVQDAGGESGKRTGFRISIVDPFVRGGAGRPFFAPMGALERGKPAWRFV